MNIYIGMFEIYVDLLCAKPLTYADLIFFIHLNHAAEKRYRRNKMNPVEKKMSGNRL